jgi:hypothetical protein
LYKQTEDFYNKFKFDGTISKQDIEEFMDVLEKQ